MRFAVTVLLLGLVTSVGAAQESPYVDFQDRTIKALSAEDVAALLAGEGRGYALAAELNGFPGPRHVLDLADSLGLAPEQRRRVQELFDRMQGRARALGREVVRREAGLDSAFAMGTVDASLMAAGTMAIARAEGELRAVHLGAHLEMMTILTEEQIHRYRRLRGYHGGHH